MFEIEHVLSSQNILGEGPVWNPDEQAIYWVDIEGKTIQRFYPETGKLDLFTLPVAICAFGFREKGGMVVATAEGFAFWDPDSNRFDPIASPEAGKEGARFNDGKVDRQGRFWAGTMTPDGATSSLYRLDPDLTVHKMESGVTISNGVGWSPDNRLMYFVDTMRRVINVYDFDPESGAISNKNVFYRISEDDGVPDGITVDQDGYIWCALCMGWKVIRIAPTGELDTEIKMPVWLPTSCAFGGKDLDELYITTGWVTMSAEQRKEQPYSGDLLRIRTQVKGVVEPKFKG